MTDGVATGVRYAAIGVEFAAIIVIAVVIGYRLDQWLGTAPFLMLLLTAGGFVGALRRLLWSLKRDTSEHNSP